MKLKEYRGKKNCSQAELARRVGVSQQAVSGWEKEGGVIAEEHLPALARFLGCKADDLRTQNPKRPKVKAARRDQGATRRESIDEGAVRSAVVSLPSMAELSRVSGVSRRAIGEFAKGSSPRLETLRSLRDAVKYLAVSRPADSPPTNDQGEKLAGVLVSRGKKPRKTRSDAGASRDAEQRPWWDELNDEPLPSDVIRANGGVTPSPIIGSHNGVPLRDAEAYDRGRDAARKREAAGVSERELASRLGVSPWAVRDTEIGRGGVPLGEYEAALTHSSQ